MYVPFYIYVKLIRLADYIYTSLSYHHSQFSLTFCLFFLSCYFQWFNYMYSLAVEIQCPEVVNCLKPLPYIFYDTLHIFLVFYMCLILMLINGFVDTVPINIFSFKLTLFTALLSRLYGVDGEE